MQKKRARDGGGVDKKIKNKKRERDGCKIETRKISRKINDRPVQSLFLDSTPRRAYEIQFAACAISLQLVKGMTCQPSSPEGGGRAVAVRRSVVSDTPGQCSVFVTRNVSLICICRGVYVLQQTQSRMRVYPCAGY